MHILGLPTDLFNVYPASVKYKTYQARWQIGDIYVSGDARKTEDNPQGLRLLSCYDWQRFVMIFSIFSTVGIIPLGICSDVVSEDTDWIISTSQRLDIAIDDKNEKPFFTIEQIKKKCEKEEFISNSEATTLTKTSLTISIPQRQFISVLVNRDCPTAYDKDKSVQNIIRPEEVGS